MRRWVGLAALAGWVLGLVAVIAGAGPGGLAGSWLRGLDPAATTVALLLRAVAVLTAARLLADTVAAVLDVARCAGAGLSHRSPGLARRAVVAMLGTTLAAAAAASTVPPAMADTPTTVVTTPDTDAGRRETATLTNLGGRPAPPPNTTPHPTRDPSPDPAPLGGGEREWIVRPGDHLWRMAEQTLREAWGRPVDDEEVAPFWLRVVAVNRPRLVDPGNPDLILPGQHLIVPASPAAGDTRGRTRPAGSADAEQDL